MGMGYDNTSKLFDIEADIFMLECVKDNIICEATSNQKEGLFAKIKRKIKELFDKIRKLFQSKKASDKNKKLEEAVLDDPNLKTKKIEIKNYDKVYKEGLQTIDKLKKEKDPEKAKSLVEKFKKSVPTILATSTVVSLGWYLGYSKKLKSKVDRLESDITRKVEEANNQLNDTIRIQNNLIDSYNDKEEENMNKIKNQSKTIDSLHKIIKNNNEEIHKMIKDNNGLYTKNISLDLKIDSLKDDISFIKSTNKDKYSRIIELTNNIIKLCNKEVTDNITTTQDLLNEIRDNSEEVIHKSKSAMRNIEEF